MGCSPAVFVSKRFQVQSLLGCLDRGGETGVQLSNVMGFVDGAGFWLAERNDNVPGLCPPGRGEGPRGVRRNLDQRPRWRNAGACDYDECHLVRQNVRRRWIYILRQI